MGKGPTKSAALAGCLCEAIERYNGTYTNQLQKQCRFSDISLEAIHPHELIKCSETQYVNRNELNARGGPFSQIPLPYDNSTIGWTQAQSLIDGSLWYVPSSFCYLTYPFRREVSMCPGDSNGCASGNTIEEAIYYGLLELVERDAVAIWWYNRIRRPEVKLDAHLFQGFQRPDIDHFTVKVIIPELRHFWSRLAPGRLYDVPVKLKWVDNRLLESEMNKISYFV